VSNGEPLCAKAATGIRTRSVAIDTDVGNLRIHFRCLGERFMESSISANSTPHKQVVGDRLISPHFSVQDFFGHRQCLPVIVRSLLGMQRHYVTNLESVSSKDF
jgi:hypothetical protein